MNIKGHGRTGVSQGRIGNIRERYSDLRTVEGKQLSGIMTALIDDLGGPEALSGFQNLVLAGLRGKIIILLQIGRFLDEAISIVSSDGTVPPVLDSTYLRFTEIARRDLETLAALGSRRKHQVPTAGRPFSTVVNEHHRRHPHDDKLFAVLLHRPDHLDGMDNRFKGNLRYPHDTGRVGHLSCLYGA